MNGLISSERTIEKTTELNNTPNPKTITATNNQRITSLRKLLHLVLTTNQLKQKFYEIDVHQDLCLIVFCLCLMVFLS